MKTILFQGDSITDCHRKRENPDDLGQGYAMLAAKALEKKYPGQFRFVNRGISGDKVTDLYERRQQDILDVKPDVMSILIGVNDVWHEKTHGVGVDVDTYMNVYGRLLRQIKKELPDTEIICIINSGIRASIIKGMNEICERYGIKKVSFENAPIDKLNGHPTEQGMTDIKNHILNTLK